MKPKSPSKSLPALSRREQQIMDVVYAKGSVTSKEVQDAISDPPSYSGVRALMRILVEKGVLSHRRKGLHYVFEPVIEAGEARQSALSRITQSFFNNSATALVAALLDSQDIKITPAELQELKRLIGEKEAQNQ